MFIRRSLFVPCLLVVAACGDAPNGQSRVDAGEVMHDASTTVDGDSLITDAAPDGALDGAPDSSVSPDAATCTDLDGDGFGIDCTAGPDCNDTNAAVNPAQTDVCGDGIDSDCSGTPDEGCACPLLTVTCVSGCCAVPAVEIAVKGRWPSVATDADGYIYVSYTIQSGGIWMTGFAIFNPTTGTWSKHSFSNAGLNSTVKVSASGRVHHVIGGATYDMWYRFSDDHGATWTWRGVPVTTAIGGGIDVAIGAGDVPHIVVQAQGPTSWSKLMYGVWNGSTWTLTELDTATTEKGHPKLVLGFADRPHIFSDAYKPDGVAGKSVRHAFYDGAAWVYENVETGSEYGYANEFYAAFQPEMLPDDSIRLIYTRGNGTSQEVVRGVRAAGSTGTWTLTPLAGISTTFANAVYLHDVAGAPALVANGLTKYRQTGGTGAFVATSTGRLGEVPGIAEWHDEIVVAYSSTEPSTAGRLYVTKLAP